ncbi:MAG: exopolysaccharide biosynthesis protein [Roseivirga sp.]|nr:exopolysaccharide biosynthesis protein [Roseivirga sp.]
MGAKNSNENIDVVEVLKSIWVSRRLIIKVTIVTVILGVIYSLLAAKVYEATTTILPQTNEGVEVPSRINGLASLAGINLGAAAQSSEIGAILYPRIVNSVPFRREILNTPINSSKTSDSLTLREYKTQFANNGILGGIYMYTIGLPSTIRSWTKNESAEAGQVFVDSLFLTISQEEQEMIAGLSENLTIFVDAKDGTISITSRMPEPVASAQLAVRAQQLLKEAITDFKIKKAKEELTFTKALYEEKRLEFEKKQEDLANFRDRNKNITLSITRNQEERLEAEYSLALNIFNELATQLETAKLKVREETPSFAVLDPVVVPGRRSSPKRAMIVIMSGFAGVLLGLFFVFVKYFMAYLRKQW